MDRVNVAVIGLGMGRAHLHNYLQSPQANVVAICDANTERLNTVGDQNGIQKRFTEIEELFNMPGLEAVSVALPNFLHAPVTIAALKAGLHVMCEKPLAMNAQEGEAMVAAAKAAGKQLMVHFNTRYQEPSRFARKIVDEGLVGPIYFGRTGWHRNRGIPGGIGGWFTSKERAGGGPLIDLGVHRLDLALWLMDYPKPVAVTGSTYSELGKELCQREGREFDVEDLAAGFIRFENGASLILESSWATNTGRANEGFTTLMGLKGGLYLHNEGEGYEFRGHAYHEVGGQLVEVQQKQPLPPATPQGDFVKALLAGKPVPASGDQGLQVMRILDALYLSAAEGREIRL
ncbi:MAG TPA: Gfo/Idh/MocA family oxidoreductase [Armatimonadota bacterium]|nr:Gfo/Idh/MocA family oxidoreductase [Armatimonadota bacterium]